MRRLWVGGRTFPLNWLMPPTTKHHPTHQTWALRELKYKIVWFFSLLIQGTDNDKNGVP